MVMLPALAKIKKMQEESRKRREEMLLEGRLKGRQEGLLEEREKWVQWKEAAERAGVVFPEPSPDERDNHKC